MFQPMKQGRERATRIVNGAGYKMGGNLGAKNDDREADVKLIKQAISEHDSQLHPGSHTRIKLKEGGFADGGMAPARMDQRGRSGKGKQPPKSQVNIVVAGHPGAGAAPGAGAVPPPIMPPPRPAPPPMPPPRPPMAGAPGLPPGGLPPGGMVGGPGMLPPGAPPPGGLPPRPMGIKTGGNVGRGGEGEPAMKAGSGSGEGRLEKARREGFSVSRRD